MPGSLSLCVEDSALGKSPGSTAESYMYFSFLPIWKGTGYSVLVFIYIYSITKGLLSGLVRYFFAVSVSPE